MRRAFVLVLILSITTVCMVLLRFAKLEHNTGRSPREQKRGFQQQKKNLQWKKRIPNRTGEKPNSVPKFVEDIPELQITGPLQQITSIEELEKATFVMIRCSSNEYFAAVPLPSQHQQRARLKEKVWAVRRATASRLSGWTLQGHHLAYLAQNHWGGLSVTRIDIHGYAVWDIVFHQDKTVSIRSPKTETFLAFASGQKRKLHPKAASGTDPGSRFTMWRANCSGIRGCWGYSEKEEKHILSFRPTSKSHPPVRPFLNNSELSPMLLFTSPKDMSGLGSEALKENQRRVFKVWSQLPGVEEAIFTHDGETAKEAARLGLLTSADFAVHPEFKQPTYRELFDRAANSTGTGDLDALEVICLSNADILYTRDLPETVTFVRTVLPMLKALDPSATLLPDEFLIVGERINSRSGELTIEEGSTNSTGAQQWEKQLYTLAERGESFQENAEDYFVITQKLWRRVRPTIPPFVLGGVAFDNWFVSKLIKEGHCVIDATHSVTALHLDHGPGKASHKHPKSDFNRELAVKHGGWSYGHVSHTPYFTFRNPATGELTLWKRRSPLVFL
eukprot:TRINITY_DN3685_c0_g1_i1.p1 TRINITY_DN3685_c0_g1~~TRINITY_DN3685_c0_g1_i1.p1  ORF type:complete len:561 (+),score=68.86 TRINITY_DN3685_c0_g1_i1:921-2603(+)